MRKKQLKMNESGYKTARVLYGLPNNGEAQARRKKAACRREERINMEHDLDAFYSVRTLHSGRNV